MESRWVTSAHIVNSAETFGTRLATRTKWVATKSIAAIPAESIPFLRIAVLIANAGYELYAVCVSVTDHDQLYSDLGVVSWSSESLHRRWESTAATNRG